MSDDTSSSPGSYGPPVLRVDKGENYTIEFTVPAPHGVSTAVIPISEARRLAQVVARMADEQEAQLNADLSKLVTE